MEFAGSLLSSGQAAELLHVHPETLRRWEEKKVIRAERTPGGHRRYRRAQIEKLRNQIHGATPQAFAYEATVAIELNFNAPGSVKVYEAEVKPLTYEELGLADHFKETLLKTGQWGHASYPALQITAADGEDAFISARTHRHFLDKTQAEKWLAEQTKKLIAALKQLKPKYGVIGLEPADLQVVQETGIFAEYEYLRA